MSRNVDYYCTSMTWCGRGKGEGRQRERKKERGGRRSTLNRVPGVLISKNRKNLVSGKKPIS